MYTFQTGIGLIEGMYPMYYLPEREINYGTHMISQLLLLSGKYIIQISKLEERSSDNGEIIVEKI